MSEPLEDQYREQQEESDRQEHQKQLLRTDQRHDREERQDRQERREDEKTRRYLRTNGPPDHVFEPDVPPEFLVGKNDGEKWLYGEISKGAKQRAWLITETIGLKQTHRSVIERLDQSDAAKQRIEEMIAPFVELRDKWLTRKKVVRNIFISVVTLLVVPTVSVLMAELLKPWFLRLFGIKLP